MTAPKISVIVPAFNHEAYIVARDGAESIYMNCPPTGLSAFGILKLTLHASSYDWRFVPIAGSTYSDSGTGTP